MSKGRKVEADVVIVGSGIAGAMTACKLAQLGVRRIVIVEAGPRIDRSDTVLKFRAAPYIDSSSGFPNTPHAPRPDWNDKANPYIEQVGPAFFNQEYLRVVGGTTWHWGGCTPRFRPVDFRLRSAHGVGADWPIDYDTLEPFYTEAEEEIGIAGEEDDGSPRSKPYPLPRVPSSYSDKVVAEGLKSIGITFNARPAARATRPYRGRGQCQGFGACSPICPTGAQYAAIYHVEQAEQAGVKVLDNTRVDRIHTDGQVTFLEARKPDGSAVTLRAKVFVLAANGLETPRLLLMSANENLPKGVANSSGQVGRNFMEHPCVSLLVKMPKPVFALRGPQSTVTSSDFRDGPFRKERPSGLISIENQPRFHNTADQLLQKGLEPPQLDAEIRDTLTRLAQVQIGFEQLPVFENGISLNWDKRDRAGQPLMRNYYSFSDYEQAGFAFAREIFKKIVAALNAEVLSIGDPSPQFHLMGMTRMGKDPKTSVTDGFGRSHDHKNLFIMSSSLFPSASVVNPTLTLAALALRTAHEIARQLKGN
jgi:choline dehydrogenase-like flavoprotein